MYFTSGMQKNKKKKPRHCHIIDAVESHGIGGKREESLFYKDRILIFFYRGQNQKSPILQERKTLLTLFIIIISNYLLLSYL